MTTDTQPHRDPSGGTMDLSRYDNDDDGDGDDDDGGGDDDDRGTQ